MVHLKHGLELCLNRCRCCPLPHSGSNNDGGNDSLQERKIRFLKEARHHTTRDGEEEKRWRRQDLSVAPSDV